MRCIVFSLSKMFASRFCDFSLGISLDRVLHDCLHSQLLGTGKTVNGSAIIYLAERGYWGNFPNGLYQDALAVVLRQAHVHFLNWKKQHRLVVSQPRFTPARLGRKTRMNYPVLSSKGIPSKVMTFWIANCCVEFASRQRATDLDRMVSTCLHAYASALRKMDTTGLVLTEEEAESYYQSVNLHLLSYAALHTKSRNARGRDPGRTMWYLLTKHHHYYHHAKVTRRERINPRMSQLLAAEDWVGRLGRIARATHKGNVSRRTLERYLCLVHLELNKLWSLWWLGARTFAPIERSGRPMKKRCCGQPTVPGSKTHPNQWSLRVFEGPEYLRGPHGPSPFFPRGTKAFWGFQY